MGNLPELCDDILIDIFLRLPVVSVCRLKCVSKSWHSFLSSPSFGSEYLSSENRQKNKQNLYLPPVLGLFQGSAYWPKHIRDKTAPKLSFFNSRFSSLESRSFVHRLGYFMGSSNGLILCGCHPTTYYVCNPCTDRWVLLPKPNNNQNHNGGFGNVHVVVGFLYEDDKGAYKVIQADLTAQYYGTTLPIRTYSSDTGVWENSVLRSSVPFQLIRRWPAHVISGVFFWLGYQDTVAAYDPNTSRHWFWLIKLPPQPFAWLSSFIFGESRDGLLQCGVDDYPGFQILTLSKKLCSYSFTTAVEVSEWIPTIRVPYIGWPQVRPELVDYQIAEHESYPYLLAFHPQSTNYVYMRSGSHVYLYDVVTDTTVMMTYVGGEILWISEFFLFPYFSPRWPWLPALL